MSSTNTEEAVITDESATVRLVLWETDINKIESRRTCYLKRAVVKDFNKLNYITLNRQTEIIESVQSVERLDEDLGHNIKYSLPSHPKVYNRYTGIYHAKDVQCQLLTVGGR